MFEEFYRQYKAGRRIKIAIMIGSPANPADFMNGGRMWAAAQKVWDLYANHPVYRTMYQKLDGKPMLLSYVGTPVPFTQWGMRLKPDWDDTRFTVRHVTGALHVLNIIINESYSNANTGVAHPPCQLRSNSECVASDSQLPCHSIDLVR